MLKTDSRTFDFDQLCRLCLEEKPDLMDIFDSSEDDSSVNVEQKIKACASIDLFKGDGLPRKICNACLSCLNAAYTFKIRCENADKTLHKMHETNEPSEPKTGNPPPDEVKEPEVECSTQASMPFSDLDQVIFVKKYGDIDEEEIEIEDTEMSCESSSGKKSGQSDCLTIEDLMTSEELVASSDSLEVSSEETSKPKVISFSLERPNVSTVTVKSINMNKKQLKTRGKKTKVKVHDDGEKSACPYCNKMLTRVNEHIRLLHQNKVYICKKPNCNAEFSTLKNLQSHQLKCYNMEKPYKCLNCFRRFYRKSNYKSHVRRHSDKKDFPCQLCDKAFVDSTGLKRHFLKHHEPQQETFVSSCCGKKFKSKEGLRQHIQKSICGLHVVDVRSNDEPQSKEL